MADFKTIVASLAVGALAGGVAVLGIGGDIGCQVADHSTPELLFELYGRYQYWVWGILAGLLVFHCPYYYMLFRWFFRLQKTYWKNMLSQCRTVARVVDPVYLPEKFVEGSDYMDGIRPSFQVAIYALNERKQWVFRGEGWRLDAYLNTAAHVVAGPDTEFRIMADGRCVDVASAKFQHHDCDLARVMLSADEWSALSVKSAKVPRTALGNHQVVSCYSRGKLSTGVCSAFQSMPHVIYDGSTRPGCSGAPLYTGNTVYAMHLGAGKANLGVDSSWIAAVAFRPEASEDFILEQIVEKFRRTGQKTVYKTFDGDDIYFLSNGKYYSFDSEDLSTDVKNAMEYESSYAGAYQREGVTGTPSFDGVDSSSLNLRGASVHAGARRLRAGEVAPNQSSQVSFALLDSSENNQIVMAGLESIVAQLRRASPSTSASQGPPAPRARGQRRSRLPRRRRQRSADSVPSSSTQPTPPTQ